MKIGKREKKCIGFLLFVALFIWQLDPFMANHAQKTVTATEDPVYAGVLAIPATQGAVATSEAMTVSNLTVTDNTTDSVELGWDNTGENVTIYYVYQYNPELQSYEYVGNTDTQSYVCQELEMGKTYYYTVCGYDENTHIQGTFSEPLTAYTKPGQVSNMYFAYQKTTSVKVAWDSVDTAKGYVVYRAGSSGSYAPIATTKNTYYVNGNLSVGTSYRYKVCAYYGTEENRGAFCKALRTTTLTKAPSVTVKAGDKKTRISWKKVAGAHGYYVYCYDGSKYKFLTKLVGKTNTMYVHTGLKNKKTYKYKVKAYRTIYEVDYLSSASTAKKGQTSGVSGTSAKAKLYKTKTSFKKSTAYKDCKTLKKKLKYQKSFPIPGAIHTNVNGFSSKSMCPQGIAIADGYIVISAYDGSGVENSVLYVVKKSNKKLVTTVVLPNQTHAGGIAYDGTNLWVTQSYTVRSIAFSDIKKAADANKKYYMVSDYKTVCNLTHQAATMTYFKGKLWVASYNELVSGYLGAYTINNKTGNPTLTKECVVRIPTRVQGITFTNNNRLILSRSCQTDAKKRGFMHRLDVYKPNLSKLSKGKLSLGKVKKTIDMPTMNEEIAVSDGYLYVNFESVYFSSASKRVDRVCVFKASSIIK